MKMFATLVAGAACAALYSAPTFGQTIDSALDDVLAAAAPDEVVSVLVYLDDQADLRGLREAIDVPQFRMRDRHRLVTLALKDTAAASQPALLAELEALRAKGRVADFEAFWITNAIRVDAPRATIEAIAARPDVYRVFFNHPIEGVAPTQVGPVEPGQQGGIAGAGPEPGVDAVRAPEVWDLGVDGSGVLVATLDTGVDGSHPALASRWRGLDPAYAGNPGWAFFDPVTNW
ncbi:MAG: hypothetical protein ACYTGR_11185, partial [Planctomycetota bacterium]